jgi:hypothetical protein
MQASVVDWIRPFVVGYDQDPMGSSAFFYVDWLRELQNRLRLTPPLPWGRSAEQTANALLQRMNEDGELTLDVLDYTLRHLDERVDVDGQSERDDRAAELARALDTGGSAWDVTAAADGRNYALTRRALGPITEAIDDIRTASERAGDHLAEAWRQLAGRTPNPDAAYFQAVLAVEAAAKPVVSPNDSMATLGRMMGAIKANPHMWTFVLGRPEDVLGPAGLLWENHRRHGTDDREAPMGMSQAEADAGVHLAITLVRWFAGGAFSRV